MLNKIHTTNNLYMEHKQVKNNTLIHIYQKTDQGMELKEWFTLPSMKNEWLQYKLNVLNLK